MSKQNTKLYLQDIIDALARINQYTKGLNLHTFVKDIKTIDAVIRNFYYYR